MSETEATFGAMLCALFAAGFLVGALRVWRAGQASGDPEAEDADTTHEGSDRPAKRIPQARRLQALGARLRPDKDRVADLRTRLVHAGIDGKDAVDIFLSVRLIVMIGGLGAALLMVSMLGEQPLTMIVLVSVVMAVAIVGPSSWLKRRTERRQQAVLVDLPEVLELLVVCLEAGLPFEQALERVVRSALDNPRQAGVLVRELQQVLGDIHLGVSFDRAFRRFAQRIGSEEVHNVAGLIAKGAAMGAKMAELLHAHSESARQREMLRLQESTGKANAKLSLPLTLCLLPAALLLMIGPAALALFRGL